MAAGSLQTLGFCTAMSARGRRRAAPLLAPFPIIQAPFRQYRPVPSAISRFFTEARLASRRPRATGGSDQVDESRYYAKDSISPELFSWANEFLNFARNNFLPLALVSGIFVGLANPSLGHLADRYPLSKFSTVAIFLISGLMLRSEEIGAAREAWPALILGLTSILLFTPFFARVILQVHLNPHEFVTGLGIFCCMPTTLSSGVALTQLVRGNSALALAMTVISNFLGTLTVLRDFVQIVAIYVDQNRKILSVISALLLSLVPATQVSRSKALLFTVRPEVFATAVVMGVLLHVTLLAFNTVAVRILSMLSGGKESVFAKKENSRAFIIVASQKTLPVMVAVVEQLGGALGDPALLILPCVAAHINQIILDSFLVNWWTKDHPSPDTGKVQSHAKSE